MITLYHVTPKDNIESILRSGLIPSYGNGLMTNRDKKTYLTNSHKYMKIMAEDIGRWNHYVILKVKVDENDLSLIWWKGKGYKEWTINKAIPPQDIIVVKEVNVNA